MAPSPQVTICVPVYNGAEFVAQTLNSIARQTYPEVRVIISDDASTDGSAEQCRVIAQQHGFDLIVQPQRRGWLENCNALLERARGDFVCIVPHDDVLDERYIAALAAHLTATPACAQAFCDVQGFGSTRAVQTQSSLIGSPFDRLHQLITRHFDGTPFRGLVRREALDRAGNLPGNAFDGFAADVNWVARLAREGEIHRVPQALYAKRFHARSTAHAWSLWAADDKRAAWADHCGDLLGVALELELTTAERWLIAHAACRRLIMANDQPATYAKIRNLPTARKVEMVDALLDRFGAYFLAEGTSPVERRRIAAVMIDTLTAANAPDPDTVLTPRTLANLARFLRKKPQNLKPR
ncbi:MAG TPA: glycosyltransferase family 2 protein [Xanthobacteraceae bacterium]|nr:glycosyltransferase family 2 protein [Xanthobacteraceae bacterium]